MMEQLADEGGPVPEVSEAFLQQFVEGLRDSAAAQRASADAMREVATEIKGQSAAISSLEKENREGRISAVAEVKSHVTSDVELREKWWRSSFKIWAAAMVIATLLGVPIGRIIAALLKIK